MLERSLRRASGEGLGYIIHFTCGIHPAARYTGTCFLEDQRVLGYNAVGLGLPFWMPGGGENHPDAVLSKQSLWLDGEQIVKDGIIVGPPRPGGTRPGPATAISLGPAFYRPMLGIVGLYEGYDAELVAFRRVRYGTHQAVNYG